MTLVGGPATDFYPALCLLFSHQSLKHSCSESLHALLKKLHSQCFAFCRIIFEALSKTDPEKKDNATGIQLLGIVLANGLSPFSAESSISEDR